MATVYPFTPSTDPQVERSFAFLAILMRRASITGMYTVSMPKQDITATRIFTSLKKLYDPPASFLNHRNAFDLLIVTLLSAQCTDVRVNTVSKTLFKKYRTPKDYVKVARSELEMDIRSTGFYRTKTKNIQALCRILITKHGGKAPNTMEELTALPGVGRKTAAIILFVAFGKNDGIAVDTHVLRLSRRLGLTKHADPKKAEIDLIKALPRKHWGRFNPLMISHGRAVCTAKKRNCGECVFQKECPSSLVMGMGDLAKP